MNQDTKNTDFSKQTVTGLPGGGASLPIAESDVTNLVADLAAKAVLPIAQANVTGLTTSLGLKEDKSAKAANSGYASLDSGGQVPLSQLGNVPGGAEPIATFLNVATAVHSAGVSNPAGPVDASNNGTLQVSIFRFTLPMKITVAKLIIGVTTSNATGHFAVVGIYSNDGNTKLIDSGQINVDTPLGFKSKTLGSPVVLVRGEYWLAMAGDGANQIFNALQPAFIGATGATDENNLGGVVNQGVAGNAATGSIGAVTGLPATLGTPRVRVNNEGFGGACPLVFLQA